MEWILFVIFMFLLFVLIRVTYIIAYKTGAKRIIAEWKASLDDEEVYEQE